MLIVLETVIFFSGVFLAVMFFLFSRDFREFYYTRLLQSQILALWFSTGKRSKK